MNQNRAFNCISSDLAHDALNQRSCDSKKYHLKLYNIQYTTYFTI